METMAKKRARPRSLPSSRRTRSDLIGRDFTVNPNVIKPGGCGVITYLRTFQGWLYLATVIDRVSRRVVRWALAPSRAGAAEAPVAKGPLADPRGFLRHYQQLAAGGDALCAAVAVTHLSLLRSP
jgi:transposase InsO family protein